MMLRYIKENSVADKIEKALFSTLSDGQFLTPDLGGNASSKEFTDAIIKEIQG